MSDAFGRRGEDETDAFGRPIQKGASSEGGSLWSGADPAAAERPSSTSAFRPPTDAAPDASAWTAAPPVFEEETRPAVETADYMQRVGAATIDLLIRLVILTVVVLLGAAVGGEDGASVAIFAGLWLIVPFYAPILMSRWDGQTVGHRAVGTRIVTKKGTPVTGGKAVQREVLVKNFLIELIGALFTFGILVLVNYLWPLWDPRDEALHDKICDTRVVKA